jgi:three-Cys-motif partner protein
MTEYRDHWPAHPHTLAKLYILELYLGAWLNILGSRFERIAVVDGFCGPGMYETGERGSPIVALDCIKAVFDRGQGKSVPQEVDLVFIEKDPKRFQILSERVDSYLKNNELSNTVNILRRNDAFEEHTDEILQLTSNVPCFFFFDPFGINVPFGLLERIMNRRSNEVLYYFHPRSIILNACNGNIENQRHVIDVYGDNNAIHMIRDSTIDSATLFFQRVNSIADYVLRFSMRNKRNTEVYQLFFLSNHIRGFEKMKEAMWQGSDTENFEFSDANNPNQLPLFDKDEDAINNLQSTLMTKFSGKSVSGKDIREFVIKDTPYVNKHKTKALRELRKCESISVMKNGSPYNRGFPDDVLVTFV